ncbi:hypothetical protein KC850_00625 [Candidatus Kaiserbacteria bacterium]|nr:hypothetical protein [Candidatus Kaiserbacteria bacterium]
MHQGNWKCSACGGTITELPFEPKSEKGLTCRDCWSKSKGISKSTTSPEPASVAGEIPDDIPFDAGVAGEPMPADDGFADATPIVPGEKKRFEGDWSCAGCGGAITSLPFNPRDTSNLKCIDCFKASKQ